MFRIGLSRYPTGAGSVVDFFLLSRLSLCLVPEEAPRGDVSAHRAAAPGRAVPATVAMEPCETRVIAAAAVQPGAAPSSGSRVSRHISCAPETTGQLGGLCRDSECSPSPKSAGTPAGLFSTRLWGVSAQERAARFEFAQIRFTRRGSSA